MTSRAHALAREALVRTLTAYSGITTEDGETDGTTLVDSNLKGINDFISEKTILIMSGDAKDEDKGALSVDTVEGKIVNGIITLQGTGFSTQIKAGTIFRVLNISTVEMDVARVEAKLDAVLDIVRGTSGAVSVDGGEDNLYNESNANEFVLLELRVDLNTMEEGDTIVFKVYTTEGGTERKISEDAANTFTGVQDPARVEIIGSANQVWGREGIRVCAVKVEGTTREVTAFYRDAKRGT